MTEFLAAVEARADRWVVACGGTEQPFTNRNARRMVYVFNPATGRHAYLDLGSDIVFADVEGTVAQD